MPNERAPLFVFLLATAPYTRRGLKTSGCNAIRRGTREICAKVLGAPWPQSLSDTLRLSQHDERIALPGKSEKPRVTHPLQPN
jgi:hypothetical protein